MEREEDKTKVAENIVLELDKSGSVDSQSFAAAHKVDHQEVVGALKSLSAREVVALEQYDVNELGLTSEGEQYANLGSPEVRLWNFLSTPQSNKACEEQLKDTFKFAMGQAMKLKWIKLVKNPDNTQTLERVASAIEDTTQAQLQLIQNRKFSDVKDVEGLKRRKLVVPVVIKAYKVTKGPKFSVTDWNKKPETDLTMEMIATGSWKTAAFKDYNWNTLGVMPSGGHLHPILKVRHEFRNIFLELGFEEMPTNNFVESSFWNFDALFQPQSHPARDAHDTFFIAEPSTTRDIPADYMKVVKQMHEVGGHGSIGYRYDWQESEARKNILRTHTTAVSTRMLYLLGQNKPFVPKKYFSIDRVFRNEATDATHLAEFHQVEGLIADYNLTLPDLIGSIAQFFEKWGITNIRFKPAYNPYTEPSMEIFAYHPGLGKWVEIGNSGMFRPEMLLPMGLPPDVRVIAWGLSLERPTMIKYKLNNIRDLVGHKVDLDFVKNNPICRLDK